MPNAIAPIEAQINIAKFNKSDIPPASGLIAIASRNRRVLPPEDSPRQPVNVYAIVSEEGAALTLISVGK